MKGKKYIEFLDEISSDELYEGLLSYGLFAEKLPPIFSSTSFFEYCLDHHPVFGSGWGDYISSSTMRNTFIPRVLSIPNPMKYQRLSMLLAENWDLLRKHFREQTNDIPYKISRIHFRKTISSKSLFQMNYKNWYEDGNPETSLLLNDRGASRYLVRADISTCFPSIYSHAIPWALVGKKKAKETARDVSLWYNKIDHACSDLKAGETHGLPIGPHSSNLLSEVILTVVDKQLYSKGYRFFRNIDDYDCYVTSYDEALLFLRDLEAQLKEFDLPVNHKKTTIVELPVVTTNNWVHKLRGAQLVDPVDGIVKYQRAESYLDLALSLSREYNDAAILNFAIKRLSKHSMTRNASDVCGSRIMHLALLYPYLLPLLEEYVFESYSVEIDRIKEFSDALLLESKRINNFEGVCYSFYFSLRYGFALKDLDIDWVIEQKDCILLILSWLYVLKENHGKKTATRLKPFIKLAKELKTTDMDRYWIFCYEVLTVANLEGEWKDLKKSKVSFLQAWVKDIVAA